MTGASLSFTKLELKKQREKERLAYWKSKEAPKRSHEEVSADVEAFLARGGEITRVGQGESGYRPKKILNSKSRRRSANGSGGIPWNRTL